MIFFLDQSLIETSDLLHLLLLDDIKAICKSFKFKTKPEGKSKLIESLIKHCSKQTTLTFSKSSGQILRQRAESKLGKLIKLSDNLYNVFYKIHLLYSFTNPEFMKPSDLHIFLRKILYGDIVLPQYDIDSMDVFESTEEFQRYLFHC